jgi:1,5-anhydro-D-fructose reductase (1,5-anhydro-D-mannitol-forming)
MTTPSGSAQGLSTAGPSTASLSTAGLRWALVGASDIAATKVLPAIRAVGGEAVVVRSGSADLARTYAQEHAIGASTTDLAEAVGRDDVDAVYVSSVNKLHLEQVVAAAAAGKHVLAEKPLALSVSDATAMVAACRAAGVVMATNHHLPASPTHIALKKAVRDGLVGEVRAIRVHHAVQLPPRLAGWRINDPEGGGVVLDVTVHDAAAVAAILGTHAISVTAQGATQDNDPGGPDDAVVTTAMWHPMTAGAPPVLVQTHDAYNNAHLPTSLHILGTRGALVGEGCNTGDPVGTVTLWRDGASEPLDVGPREDLYERTVRAFTAAVRGEGDVIVTGEDGVASLAVSIAVLESLRSGTRVAVQS